MDGSRNDRVVERAANNDPAYVQSLREQFSELGPERLLRCIRIAIGILEEDRSPHARTRGVLMLNLLREEKQRRAM